MKGIKKAIKDKWNCKPNHDAFCLCFCCQNNREYKSIVKADRFDGDAFNKWEDKLLKDVEENKKSKDVVTRNQAYKIEYGMKRGIHYDLGPSLVPREPSKLNMDTVPVTKNRCWRTESSRQRREEEEEARISRSWQDSDSGREERSTRRERRSGLSALGREEDDSPWGGSSRGRSGSGAGWGGRSFMDDRPDWF
ncbi:hypothetical protein ACOMHN_003902 [Nucella lapillus]